MGEYQFFFEIFNIRLRKFFKECVFRVKFILYLGNLFIVIKFVFGIFCQNYDFILKFVFLNVVVNLFGYIISINLYICFKIKI